MQNIIVPVNSHEKELPVELVDRRENRYADDVQKGTLVDFSRYRGVVIRDESGELVLCSGIIKDRASDDMSKEAALMGKAVSILQDPKKLLLNIHGLEVAQDRTEPSAEKFTGIKALQDALIASQQEPEKQVYHKVILTHRKDLTARVLREPIDPNKPILEIVNHPRQEISGTLKDFSNSEFILATPEFGDVRVETHKNVFVGRDDALRDAKGKPVDVLIDATGKHLSLAVHRGENSVVILQDHFETPLRPVGLLPMVQMSRQDAQPITGKLTHVHDSNLVELQDAKGRSALVHAADPDKAHQAEIQKMVGRQVRVLPGEKLQVVALEKEKFMGIGI